MVDRALLDRVQRELPGWKVEGEELLGDWRYSDFAGALAAAVLVGALAQSADHHPELRVSYGRLEVRLTTHKADGLTEKDVTLATQIQRALQRPDW